MQPKKYPKKAAVASSFSTARAMPVKMVLHWRGNSLQW
jgi:hypothetical protein